MNAPLRDLEKLCGAFQKTSPIFTAFEEPWVWKLLETFEPGKPILRGVEPGDEDTPLEEIEKCVDVYPNGDVVSCTWGEPSLWFKLPVKGGIREVRRTFRAEIRHLETT